MEQKPKVVKQYFPSGWTRWVIVPPPGYILRGFYPSTRDGSYGFGCNQAVTMDIARKHAQLGNFVKSAKAVR